MARIGEDGMRTNRLNRLRHVLRLLAGVLVLKVTGGVVLNYREYIPPNFEAEFLRGREAYFSGTYQWAFYTHIAAGPFTLVLGMILLSERFRQRFPMASAAGEDANGVRVVAAHAERPVDGVLCGDRCRRRRGVCIAGGRDRRVRLARLEIGGAEAVCCPSPLDVALLPAVVFGGRAAADGGDRHGRRDRVRLVLSAGSMDKLAAAAGGV